MRFFRKSLTELYATSLNKVLDKFHVTKSVSYFSINDILCAGFDIFQEDKNVGYKMEIGLSIKLNDKDIMEMKTKLNEKYKNQCFFEFDKIQFDSDMKEYYSTEIERRGNYVYEKALEIHQTRGIMHDISKKCGYTNEFSNFREQDASYLMVYGTNRENTERIIKSILADKGIKPMFEQKQKVGVLSSIKNLIRKRRLVSELNNLESKAEGVQRDYEFSQKMKSIEKLRESIR